MEFIFSLNRAIIYRLLTFKPTYLIGMVLVRMSRFIKRQFVSEKNNQIEIDNFFGNIKMSVNSNSYMGGSIYWMGFHHINELLFLNNFLKPEMTFLDIGANQGEFSLMAASKVKNGLVMSFEPVSQNYKLLQKNIKLNDFKNIDTYNYGLSDSVCEVPIYTSTDTKLHGGVHEGLSTIFRTNERPEIEENILLKKFDDEHFSTLKKLDFIKIDIEGSELFALKGMVKTIEKFKPGILIELNEETYKSAGYGIIDILNFLDQFGYKKHMIRRGILVEVKEVGESYGNYVFTV